MVRLTGRSRNQYSNNLTASSVDVFTKALDKQLSPRLRNVFISFHIDDEAQVGLLRHQAKDNEFGIQFRDYSVKEPFDSAWKTRCRERIALTSATIVMIGPETANREAVLWEINESLKQGKQVIGVTIYKNANHSVPKSMVDNNCRVIDWKLAKISKLLNDN